MSNENKNNAATTVAALTKVYNEALEAQKAIAEDATEEVKAEAQAKVDEAKSALDSVILQKKLMEKLKK